MPFNNLTNVYSGKEMRRSNARSSSIPSSMFTDDFLPYPCVRARCHCELTACMDDTSDTSESMSCHGSISLRRRHAEYFHRPPVLGPYARLGSGSDSPYSCVPLDSLGDNEYCDQCHFCAYRGEWCGRGPAGKILGPWPNPCLPRSASEMEIGGYEKQLKSINATWVQEPLIVGAAQLAHSENAIPREPYPPGVFRSILTASRDSLPLSITERTISQESLRKARPLSQTSAQGCTRLKLYRDIRLGLGENWAISEKSFVICLHPGYTDLNRDRAPDEFELVYGDTYVVCRMYADLWALCVRLSLESPVTASHFCRETETGILASGFQNVKFLPLCAVTLAGNFGAFDRRCDSYRKRHPNSGIFPSGGLRITPPERTHSLIASRELFQDWRCEILTLPRFVFDICSAAEVENGAWTASEHGHIVTITARPTGRRTLKKIWSRLRSSDRSQDRSDAVSTNQCLPRSPPLSLNKEISYVQSELSALQKEINASREETLTKRPVVKKRRSIMDFFRRPERRQRQILSEDSVEMDEIEEMDVIEGKEY